MAVSQPELDSDPEGEDDDRGDPQRLDRGSRCPENQDQHHYRQGQLEVRASLDHDLLGRARRQKKGASILSLLQVVAAALGIRPSEIASVQDVHPSQVTRQVRDLESLGHVQVIADTADKRSCRVTLTSAGSDELQSLTEEGLDRFGSFVADWEPEKVRMLTSLLQKLEESKAAVAARQRPAAGRRWARQKA
jgi:DNA-binding MarR family transcriptional regulator